MAKRNNFKGYCMCGHTLKARTHLILRLKQRLHRFQTFFA